MAAAAATLVPEGLAELEDNRQDPVRLALIEHVHSRPALWNPRVKEYKDTHYCDNQWDYVAQQCGLPDGKVAKAVFNKLRNTRRATKSKNRKKIKSGMAAKDAVKITWPYFEEMSFLDDCEDMNVTIVDNSGTEIIFADNEIVDENSVYSGEGGVPIITANSRSSGQTSSETPKRQRRTTADLSLAAVEQEMSGALKELNEMHQDSAYAFALNVYHTLKKLPEQEEAECRYAINRVLDEAVLKVAKKAKQS